MKTENVLKTRNQIIDTELDLETDDLPRIWIDMDSGEIDLRNLVIGDEICTG